MDTNTTSSPPPAAQNLASGNTAYCNSRPPVREILTDTAARFRAKAAEFEASAKSIDVLLTALPISLTPEQDEAMFQATVQRRFFC